MSVELNPPELGFQRPFTQEVPQTLRLRNPNHDPVAFKVKTTAPKQYCVRPNSGRIEAGNEVEVQGKSSQTLASQARSSHFNTVLLQAMKEDPPPDAKCRDKFLVQSVAVTADREFSNVASIWQHVEQTSKSTVQEKKIRVSFLPADGAIPTSAQHSNLNGAGHADDNTSNEPPAYSPSPEAVTPNRHAPVGPVSKPESRPSDSKHLGDAISSAHNPATDSPQSAIYTTASSVASAIPTSGADLKSQLAEAQAQIQKLKQQVQEHGLRQRKTDAVNQDSRERITTGTTGMGVQQQPAEGVPVQIVAGLCLLSFLLAYMFF
ncbi:MAG: phosphatidylinositol-binding protein scs2 [Sclerophora amabilis]|nr:MAG: phosphatidylinositol-binding protein scs2 [Sclerophora amabilis]